MLQDFRANSRVRADFAALGYVDENFVVAGKVTFEWRAQRVLAPARIESSGPLADLEDPALRTELEKLHAELLSKHGMPHLDISQLRSRDRIVTQTVGRSLFEDGYAGVQFKSNTDDCPCFVIFEGRGTLVPAGAPEPLANPITDLQQVCDEWDILLREERLPSSHVQGRRVALIQALRDWLESRDRG